MPDPEMEGYVAFTTREMIEHAQRLGLKVKPWTVREVMARYVMCTDNVCAGKITR